jgi:hypothetical protein
VNLSLQDDIDVDIVRQTRIDRLIWLGAYFAVLGTGLVVALYAYRRPFQVYVGLAIAVLIVVVSGWFFRPRATLYATVFLALVGDSVTVAWFPFNKNMSSFESILYISDGMVIRPVEIVLLAGVAISVARGFAAGRTPLKMGALGWPLLLFSIFLAFGLFWGLSRGGDFRAAMFEFRSLLYISLTYWLATTYCETDKHRRMLIISAVIAVFIQSVLSIDFLLGLPPDQREALDSLTEHGSAIGMNLVLLFTLTSLTYRRISVLQRFLLVVASIPVVWVMIVSQRRAGFITLLAGCVLLALTLFWRQRATFWKVVPACTIIAIGYVGAFWNSDSSIGFGAQAVKGVIAPEQLSQADQASDIYRIIENIDVHATVRSAPITGIGFGQPFLRPLKLPDISKFEFNAYLPHNSFMWIWIKTGFIGFATMIYVVGRAVSLGANRSRRVPDGPDAVVNTTAVLFVVMYMIYTYVDIAWDSRNMILLGAVLAIVSADPAKKMGHRSASDHPKAHEVTDRRHEAASRNIDA